MRWLRRGAIAGGWFAIVAALVRIGSGGGGTAENIRYAITDLPLPVAAAAMATFAAGVALVVGVLTDRRVGPVSLVAATLALGVGLVLERSGHGSGLPVAVAASITVLASVAEVRSDRPLTARPDPDAASGVSPVRDGADGPSDRV